MDDLTPREKAEMRVVLTDFMKRRAERARYAEIQRLVLIAGASVALVMVLSLR